jgi:succinate dehydrogenase hydrophobic anchor subunit
MQWLHAWNVLRITDQNYIKGKRTKRYFVNTALVVWLLGFGAHEARWN